MPPYEQNSWVGSLQRVLRVLRRKCDGRDALLQHLVTKQTTFSLGRFSAAGAQGAQGKSRVGGCRGSPLGWGVYWVDILRAVSRWCSLVGLPSGFLLLCGFTGAFPGVGYRRPLPLPVADRDDSVRIPG